MVSRLVKFMDCYNYPENHQLHDKANKAQLGFFKDKISPVFLNIYLSSKQEHQYFLVHLVEHFKQNSVTMVVLIAFNLYLFISTAKKN